MNVATCDRSRRVGVAKCDDLNAVGRKCSTDIGHSKHHLAGRTESGIVAL